MQHRPLPVLRLLTSLLLCLPLLAACGSSKSGSDSASSSSSGPTIGGTADDTGAVAWPAPASDQVTGLATSAGLQMETQESLAYHVHAHLDIFIDGAHRTVPGGLGIVIDDPKVHSGTIDGQPAYGGIVVACDQPCISPLHTHDVTGILHTESATTKNNTLGQLFVEWAVPLTDTCVGEFCTPATSIALYVDGKVTPLAGATAIALSNHKEIAVVIGTPPARIPSEGDFSKV